MSIETKQLHALSKIYKEAVYGGGKKEAPKDTRMVVTNADKKANTKAYQNMKAGVKGYKAADHLKTEDAKYGYDKDGNSLNPKDKKDKKAKKDYDGDGKVESGTDEYKGSVDKAIKKAMKKESYSDWRQDLKEIPDYDQIPVDSKKSNEKITEKKVKNTVKINPDMKEETQLDEGEGHGVSLRGLHNDRARLKDSEVGSAREKELKTRIKDKETQMQQVQSQRWNPKTKKLEKNLGSRPHVSPEAQRNEGYQRNPEAGEAKERADAKKGEAIRGQASRKMPPRGNKDREEFERWYAANVR